MFCLLAIVFGKTRTDAYSKLRYTSDESAHTKRVDKKLTCFQIVDLPTPPAPSSNNRIGTRSTLFSEKLAMNCLKDRERTLERFGDSAVGAGDNVGSTSADGAHPIVNCAVQN